jgi:hypothetical protein
MDWGCKCDGAANIDVAWRRLGEGLREEGQSRQPVSDAAAFDLENIMHAADDGRALKAPEARYRARLVRA